MKFADKLFFATTFFLAVIFTIFGIGMLSSSFQKTLHRELEQADMENQMMQYLFEMAYQSMTEYGEEYAIRNAVESAVSSLEKNGIHCYIWSDEEVYYGGGSAESIRQQDEAWKLAEKLSDGNTFASGIRQLDEEYYLLSVCKSTVAESVIYLCISRDVTVLYRDRQSMLNQYRITLILLLAVGSAGIYLLSRYLTSPISNLDKVAGKIAAGDYEQRSKYHSSDEIGKLAENFNRMADRLVEQMKEKELEAKQKEDFTAAFAHELKTPLTSIIGYADMLNSVTLTEEERREAYFYIYTQGKRLESLSYKLLELVSIEQTPILAKPVQTKELEDNIRTTMRPIWEQKKIQGKITMEKGVIYGDWELLLSLFYNLLDNAVKAVDQGQGGFILLKGRSLKEGYEVKVVDNGRGIPEQEIGRITEAFYMVDKSRSRRQGGAGIGMALCRKIIALHNGTLQVSSKLGEGTVIRLLFSKQE